MLTTLAAVKMRLGLEEADVKDDALLTSFIKLVSARIENDCNRKFGYAQNVTDEFQGDETELRVSRYPLDDAQPVAIERQVTRSEGWQAVDDARFVVRAGCVISLASEAGTWKQQLRVTYSGGYVLPGANPAPATSNPPLPDDLQLACVEQIVWLFQNKDRLGMLSISGEGGALQQFPALDLLPSVQAMVARYQRWMS